MSAPHWTWLAATVGAVVVAALAQGATKAPAQQGLRVEVARPAGAPTAELRWVPVELPLRWSAPGGSAPQPPTLRLRFELDDVPAEPLGLLLTRLSTGGRISVNQHLALVVPGADGNRRVDWRRPFLLTLPPTQLQPGPNQVLIETAPAVGRHEIGAVDVAPLSHLLTRYELHRFLATIVPWTGTTLAALIALFFGLLWLRRPDRLLQALTVAAALWFVYGASGLAEVQPQPWHRLLAALAVAGVGGFTAIVALIVLRRSDSPTWPRLSASALAYVALGPVLLLVAGSEAESRMTELWILLGGLLIALAIAHVAWRGLRGGRGPNPILLLAAGGVAAAAIHDALAAFGWAALATLPLLPWAGPLLLIALTTPLVDRFFRALHDAEAARAELESRVREREQLLKRNFERLRDSERAQVQAQERQRITQDIHDGLGSQLLSALMLVERRALTNRQVAQLLRESIDDLRLAIDALGAERDGLPVALGNLRYRMEPRLRAAGIALAWDARGLPDELVLDPGVVLPVLRIVQESLTNVLKHSRARHVRVDLKVTESDARRWLTLRVSDDGRGISDEGVRGRGLLNMRGRAARLGAQFSLESDAGRGTTVGLRLALSNGAPAVPGATPAAPVDTRFALSRLRRLDDRRE